MPVLEKLRLDHAMPLGLQHRSGPCQGLGLALPLSEWEPLSFLHSL